MTDKEKGNRRQYSKEFKIDAVELMMRSNKSIIVTAGSLGVRPDLLRRWKAEYLAKKTVTFPRSGHLKDQEDERYRKLERELRIALEERDILKNIQGILSLSII